VQKYYCSVVSINFLIPSLGFVTFIIFCISDDLSIVKQYRDQLSDDIVGLFQKIITKLWEKSTAVEENSCPIYPGGGARQSRRLKAKKQCGASEEEHDEP
jgi:hypothetical protein